MNLGQNIKKQTNNYVKGLDSEQKLENAGTELIHRSWTLTNFTYILLAPVRVVSNLWLVGINKASGK